MIIRLLKRSWSTLRNYPSIYVSLAIIVGLLAVSIYAVVAIPYSDAVRLWRGAESVWSDTPRYAMPAWTNVFRSTKLLETFAIPSSDENTALKDVTASSTVLETRFSFEYTSQVFPQEMNVFFNAQYESKKPFILLTWHTPDGREIPLFRSSILSDDRFSISQDSSLRQLFDGEAPHVGLLADPATINIEDVEPEVLAGEYELVVQTYLFEEGSSVDSRLVVYGQVHGLAGTDHRRRDLSVGLLWGTPVALLFGLLATIGTNILTFIIAAAGTWYGGWLDAVIQRLTEINIMLPFLPILIMIGTFYSRSIWLMLAVIIVLGIFSASIKTYRSMFLQVRNAPFIEAARAYGASGPRIIFRYMMPRIAPVLVPAFVTGIPAFVFLEASLAVLGLGDPILPTWGKILNDAYRGGALYRGYYYWVLEPAVMLIITGLAFSMLGFALDRIFNPRLRGL